MPVSFSTEAVEAGLSGTQFSGLIHHFPSVKSTNTLALAAAQAGTQGGVWIADEQTAGRGRGGHTWHSAAGDGLYVSALVRPSLPLTRALWLSLATGLATQTAIAEVTGLTPDIRWPNDLLLAGKKCGGILVETALAAQTEEPATLRYAVIGVGINVNHAEFPPELSTLATSLRQETGKPWPRESLLTALLRALDQEIRSLETNDNHLLERFAHASSWVRGKHVQVGEDGGYTGVTAGLNAEGFLLVEGDDGVRHTVFSGGVRAL
ncbi:biotin--[acetyl-CoA-carboxylase] ligase [Granulicella arctica]|uniref:BirA family biotin operon repressor/biotin-[acetyl-CoA-carboxylase] ligase n=1 Tax=Granulicella arctica TaxID=940613 RepID=A0A7Y9TSM1_9BACT|nr:biotin--[acetyl-CoA-carboxylase] ligase [Granulicella arctica]NYF79153.1 BirA family biotin operon repressor/biotin-[acetyl-CoA-carboxylase] ligase [Granulicella arctica]